MHWATVESSELELKKKKRHYLHLLQPWTKFLNRFWTFLREILFEDLRQEVGILFERVWRRQGWAMSNEFTKKSSKHAAMEDKIYSIITSRIFASFGIVLRKCFSVLNINFLFSMQSKVVILQLANAFSPFFSFKKIHLKKLLNNAKGILSLIFTPKTLIRR